jgi:hypothetical protein
MTRLAIIVASDRDGIPHVRAHIANGDRTLCGQHLAGTKVKAPDTIALADVESCQSCELVGGRT